MNGAYRTQRVASALRSPPLSPLLLQSPPPSLLQPSPENWPALTSPMRNHRQESLVTKGLCFPEDGSGFGQFTIQKLGGM